MFVHNIAMQSEFTWEGYKKHLVHKAAEAPLTRREQELVEVKAAEAQTVSDYQGTTTRKSFTPGIAFPLTEKAVEALSHLVKEERSFNFVSLVSIWIWIMQYTKMTYNMQHLDHEKIDLDKTAQASVTELKSTITDNAPRFTFYVYKSSSEKESLGKTSMVAFLSSHLPLYSFYLHLPFLLQDQRTYVVFIFKSRCYNSSRKRSFY